MNPPRMIISPPLTIYNCIMLYVFSPYIKNNFTAFYSNFWAIYKCFFSHVYGNKKTGRTFEWFSLLPFINVSIIVLANLEEALRMLTDRTYFGSFNAYYDMSTVTALPYGDTGLLKYFHCLDIL